MFGSLFGSSLEGSILPVLAVVNNEILFLQIPGRCKDNMNNNLYENNRKLHNPW